MEKLVKQFKDRITSPLKLMSVTTVNHQPHIFAVGTRHVNHAHDHYSGVLSDETLQAIPCARRDCNLLLDKHTYDTVMFLQLERNCTSAEVQHILKPLCDEIEAAGIDGFGFVETPQKYRITQKEENGNGKPSQSH